MLKLALLTADTRLTFQIETWLRDLASEVKLEKFSSTDDFTRRYDTRAELLDLPPEETGEGGEQSPDAAAAATAPGAPNAGTTASDSKEKPAETPAAPSAAAAAAAAAQPERYPMRLVIVDVDLIKSRPLQWLADVQKELVSKGHAPSDFPPRFLVMAFEGGTYTPQALCHPIVNDLVMKPLDRSLFLQKVEVLLADTPKVKPSFLFRQKTNVMIEAGKDAVVDEVSDFAVAIRNPAPIYEGVFASLHSSIFGTGTDSRVIGRVYSSVRHPSHEGEYLVRFSFFGINSNQILNVKKYMRSQQQPTARIKPSVVAKAMKVVKSKLTEVVRPENQRRIAVIDMNRDNVTDLKVAFESNFKDMNVRVFPSYARFLGELAKFFPATGAAPASSAPAPQPADAKKTEVKPSFAANPGEKPPEVHRKKIPAFPRGEKLTFVLNGGHHDFAHFEPLPKKGEVILGRYAEEVIERPDLLLGAIEKEDKEDFDEFLGYVERGGRGSCLLRMTDASHHIIYVEAKGDLAKTGDADGAALLRIELSELTEEKWRELTSTTTAPRVPEHMRFDAIFIDGGVLRTEPAAWLEGLKEMLKKANVWHEGLPEPKIFVMAAEKSRLTPEEFRLKGITDFFYKQADRKYLVQKINALLPQLERREPPETSPFVPCEVHVKMAKDVRMVEISEYGISVVHPSPFREGVYMRFFSHLFGDTPEGVIGRCVYCEKTEAASPGGQPVFHCNFNFFGAHDDLLKRIRSWIREDYVHKKEGTG